MRRKDRCAPVVAPSERAWEASPVRVLMVLPAPPDEQGGAADRCAIGLIDGLRGHGVDVHAIAPDFTGRWPAAAERLSVQRVPVVADTGPRARVAHLRRPLGDLARTAMREAVRDAASGVDVIHLDRSDTAWLDEGLAIPAVMSLHYRARLDRSFGWPPWRAENRELLLFRALERSAIRRHRWLVASSEPVAAAIRRDRPGADVTVVPLTLDPGAYRPAPLDGPPVAGIIGTASWVPTRDAIERLVADIWPMVRREVPDARLLVAGRGTDECFSQDVGPGFEVVGEVPSSQEFLRGLSVLLYPVRRGSGMKVKVLEAMAIGLPVVTTLQGAEGVVTHDGVVVCGEDTALVDAAASVLSDEAARRARAAAGRAAFLRSYSPVAATAPLRELYERVLAVGC